MVCAKISNGCPWKKRNWSSRRASSGSSSSSSSCKNSCSARGGLLLHDRPDVEREPARQSGRELVKLRQATEQHGYDQSVSARQEQFVARVVVVILRRRNITALAHGEAANLRLDLSPTGLFVHASTFVSTASTSLSGVRLGLTGLRCDRWSPAVGRVKSVRCGHDMIGTFH